MMSATSPPLRLHLQEGAVPVAVHKAGQIPQHWMEEVKRELDKDEALGVIAKVPANTPTTWCSRMGVIQKKDGSVRRVVDLRALNRSVHRQTHPTDAPFTQASRVPPGTWRTCVDAWNGYHSVPLAPEDRHLTTFLMPWGRYWYLVAPQGCNVSGDAFTFRYDEVTCEFVRVGRVVDHSCLWDWDLENHVIRVCEYLTLTAAHGIIQNPKKVQFAMKEVEFVGFQLTETGVRPSETMLANIKGFSRPTNISGIRSWFGIVEQVAYAFSKASVMLPFRHLLSKDEPFVWTQELQESFKLAKEEIGRRSSWGWILFCRGSQQHW